MFSDILIIRRNNLHPFSLPKTTRHNALHFHQLSEARAVYLLRKDEQILSVQAVVWQAMRRQLLGIGSSSDVLSCCCLAHCLKGGDVPVSKRFHER